MRISYLATYLALAITTTHAVSVPNTDAVALREAQPVSDVSEILSPEHALEKRKGGGGKGGGGGSSGGKSGGSSGGSTGSSGSGRTSSSSNLGGSTRAGSGAPRGYGGGGYYGGGASKPYKPGGSTPKGLIAGAILAPVLLIGLLPGLWLASAYPYHFHNPYRFRNESAQNATNANSSLPVLCLCQEDSPCGCDENDDQKYLDELIGNGSYDALNKTLVNVADVNGTKTLVLNGTLPKGTTAPGGTDDEDGAGMALALGKYTGYYAMALSVMYFCMFA